MFGLGEHHLPEAFFKGACDTHCHLLPGVDDGFASTEKSLEALRLIERNGVEKMILTPHFMKEYSDNNRESIKLRFEVFKKEAEKVCKIELRLAAEYMLDARFMEHFKQGFLALDGDNHVLCETSYLMYEPHATEKLYEIMLEGVQPVIAHPERYEYASRWNYAKWKDKRYKFQMNLLSLSGAYGGLAKAKALSLLKEGMYDYVGSDMHNVGNFERFLPKIKLRTKDLDRLEQLMENNKGLFR